MTDESTPTGRYGALHEDWTVWNDEPEGRSVLVYRPDVFDGGAFPPPCLPTIYVTRGQRGKRRPGVDPTTAADWYATLYLEPDVELDETHRYATREEAVDAAVDLARRFAEGGVDYRGLYQVPRERYFEKLDELILSDNSP